MARAKSIKYEMKQKLGSMEYFGHSKHELQQLTRQEQTRLMQEGVPFDERRRVDYCKDKVFSRNTMQTYQGEVSRYGDYLASQGLGKCGMDEASNHIQEYLDYQSGRGLSPYSVHTTAAALCKTFGHNLQDYNVPKRELANITRGRCGAIHDKYNQANPLVQQVMQANTVLGLRRNELRILTAGSFTDEGKTITMVTRGKGNKVNTCVFRNPTDIAAVRGLIQGKQAGDRVFSADAFRNDANFHASRAAAFQQRYQYYCDQMAQNPAAVTEYQQIIKDTFAASGRECKEDLNKPYVGVSGSGKSYSYEIDPRGDDEVTLVLASNLSHPGCFDNYVGQKTLYIDEIKPGGITYGKLIELIGGIKNNSICRYSTFVPMWEEVHFTSVYTPMEFYNELVPEEKRKIDTSDQLIGRISKTYLHFVTDKRNGRLVSNPRIRKQKDPENLEYHYIEFVGAPERYMLDRALSSYLYKLQSKFS